MSATVVVTAAHCTGRDFPVDRVRMTFAPVISTDGPWIMGTTHFDARYVDPVRHGGTRAFSEQSPYDLCVVILDHPDSGGPAFVWTSATIGGVLSFGKDPLCQNIDGYVRLDSASPRSFRSVRPSALTASKRIVESSS